MWDPVSWLVNAGDWLENHNGAVTAASTVLIAIFTVVLANSTRKLGKMSIKQDERMQESIGVSKDAIKISEASLVAGERAFVFPTGQINGFWELDSGTNTYNWRFRIEWYNRAGPGNLHRA